MNWRKTLSNGAKTATALTVSTTAAILAAGMAEDGAPWAPMNAIAHIVDGDDVTQPNNFAPRESTLGFGLNASAMLFWALVYEGALSGSRLVSTPITAAVAATGMYLVDYKVVPKRLTPGFEKKLSRNGVLACYVALGATLLLSSLWNDYDEAR